MWYSPSTSYVLLDVFRASDTKPQVSVDTDILAVFPTCFSLSLLWATKQCYRWWSLATYCTSLTQINWAKAEHGNQDAPRFKAALLVGMIILVIPTEVGRYSAVYILPVLKRYFAAMQGTEPEHPHRQKIFRTLPISISLCPTTPLAWLEKKVVAWLTSIETEAGDIFSDGRFFAIFGGKYSKGRPKSSHPIPRQLWPNYRQKASTFTSLLAIMICGCSITCHKELGIKIYKDLCCIERKQSETVWLAHGDGLSYGSDKTYKYLKMVLPVHCTSGSLRASIPILA